MKRPTRRRDRTPRQVPLDVVDRRLLAYLQHDNSMSNLELAKRANLSPPTCLRRVRRLRDNRVIVRDVSLVDPSKVGQGMTVFIEVALEQQQDKQQRAFEEKIRATREIAQCYVVSGESDFLLVARVSDMDAYHAFVRRLFVRDPNVRNFRSIFSMNTVKYETAVPVD
jgi:Lrp/AsnC family transcriptional regulator, leucine-responsive regulatory protein